MKNTTQVYYQLNTCSKYLNSKNFATHIRMFACYPNLVQYRVPALIFQAINVKHIFRNLGKMCPYTKVGFAPRLYIGLI